MIPRALTTIALLCLLGASGRLQAGERKFWAYVNGGGDYMSNYAVHEVDLIAFKKALFQEPYAILSAGGPGTLVIATDDKGFYLRDSQGWMMPQASSLGFPHLPARRSDFRRLFEQMKAQALDRVTLVIADHGKYDGFALWEDDTDVSASELTGYYRQLPEQTLVRTIHLHCYGGAAVADPHRKIPTRLADWPAYLDAHYLSHQCALTMSGTDELGKYLDWQQTPEKGPWFKILTERDAVSLQSIKSSLQELADEYPTPLLTSDFLVNDLAELFCATEGQPPRMNVPPFAHAPGPGKGEPFRAPISGDPASPCAGDANLEKLNEAVARVDRLLDSWSTVEWVAAKKYLADNYADRFAHYHQTWQKTDKLQDDFRSRHGMSPSLAAQQKLEHDLRQARDDEFYASLRMLTSFTHATIALAPLDKLIHDPGFPAVLAADKGANDRDRRIYAEILASPEFKGKTFSQIDSQILVVSREVQRKRMLAIKAREPQLRRFVESRLSAPGYRFLKERYERLLDCESSSLR